ncbi:MAG: alpha/beta hydrolase, partial [bacterium]
MPRRFGLVAATCVLALLAVPGAPASAAPVAEATEAPVATASNASLEWGACEGRLPRRVECGTLTVPRDWANPTAGPTDKIAVARIKATGPRLGVLSFNNGGPGAA